MVYAVTKILIVDGRVRIDFNQTSQKLAKLLHVGQTSKPAAPKPKAKPTRLDLPPPRLNIVVQIVGSRGDVQPFVALGKVLREKYGHRIRIATHATFKDFVEESGLEFFNIGGDPAQLMAFMVKNPNLMPGFDSVRHGDIGKRQNEIWEILIGCWRSCIEPGNGMDLDSLDDDIQSNPRPFVADVIIANPPSFAHVHCGEKLGIPVHMMFTMPWSPTQAFPHPLANVKSSNADPHLANILSYTLVESLTWQGLGPVINRFRQQYLRLEIISLIWSPNLVNRLQIPYTYCWSPALIPKPHDWGDYIDICGFFMLSAAASYTPAPELQAFLNAGPPPVYIGFGSIVVDDPNAMTEMIFAAVKQAGVRALVSKGWGGMGAGEMNIPENIFMLGSVPHDWLFQYVSCVVHHGGAGTTAAGLALGRPTVVVPFFGDQPFWGAMIARAGAGPSPIPYKHLTADKLAKQIKIALEPSMLGRAASMAESMAKDNGTEDGAKDFHHQLDIDHMRCSITPSRTAIWRVRKTQIRLSGLVVTVLVDAGLLKPDDVKLYRSKEFDTRSEPSDPFSALASGTVGAIGDLMSAAVSLPISSVHTVKDLAHHTAHHTRRKSSLSNSPLFGHLSKTSTTASDTLEYNPNPGTFTRSPTLVSMETMSPTSTVTNGHTSRHASVPTTGNKTTKTNSALPTPPISESKDGDPADGGTHELAVRQTSPGPAGVASHTATVANGPAGANHTSPTTASSKSSTSSESERTQSLQSAQSPSSKPTSPTTQSLRAPIGHAKLDKNPAEVAGRTLYGIWAAPFEATLSIARGFHNAPKLYGDDTVRKADKVDSFHSGIRQAGKVCGRSMYKTSIGVLWCKKKDNEENEPQLTLYVKLHRS